MKDKKMNNKTITVIEDSIKNHDKLKSFDNTEDAMNWLADKKPARIEQCDLKLGKTIYYCRNFYDDELRDVRGVKFMELNFDGEKYIICKTECEFIIHEELQSFFNISGKFCDTDFYLTKKKAIEANKIKLKQHLMSNLIKEEKLLKIDIEKAKIKLSNIAIEKIKLRS